jgi:hypothetical protein
MSNYDRIFSKKPFFNEKSVEFFSAVKIGKRIKILSMLMWNKFLVYDFDYVIQ